MDPQVQQEMAPETPNGHADTDKRAKSPIPESANEADKPAAPSPVVSRDFGWPSDIEAEPTPDKADPLPHTPAAKEKGSGGGIPKNVSFSPDDPLPIDVLPPPRRNSTPTGRRSVQFGRAEVGEENEAEGLGRDRRGGPRFLSKLRAFANSSVHPHHQRSPSGYTLGGESIDERFDVLSPETAATEQSSPYVDSPGAFNSDSDADSELSESEAEEENEEARRAAARRGKRRKSRRPTDGGIQTAPTTPKTPFMRDARPPLPHSHSQGSADRHLRAPGLLRRSTLADLRTDRQTVSDDEGRQRAHEGSPWRRARGRQGIRALSHHVFSPRDGEAAGPSDPARPNAFRRAFTGLGAAAGEGSGAAADGSPSPWKLRSERTASLSAAKWRQIKAGLKMMGRQRKAQKRIDQSKSAELLAELSAGVPAALMLASMFQRDEHGHKRIPVLLEQLKVHLADSTSKTLESGAGDKGGDGDRHLVFRIELEYGNGLTRMKWVVHRTLRDFWNLHTKYKFHAATQKYKPHRAEVLKSKRPHFPKKTFPYLRGLRGTSVSDSEEEEEEEVRDSIIASGDDDTGPERNRGKRRDRPSLGHTRRISSVFDASFLTGGVGAEHAQGGLSMRREAFPERQRRKLEQYLQQMVRWLIFRPDSNRLCKFLELSSLGLRLSAEGSYHGKEGFLIIQSGKGIDFRRAWDPTSLKARHRPKWFMVRHSYIICVDSPEEMNIYDVFLIDPFFQVQAKPRVALRDQNAKELSQKAIETAKNTAQHPQHHKLKIINSERKLRLLAKHERQLKQFEDSIKQVLSSTPWAQPNRFGSFAPVRHNVFAQWLVDGRDYMWNVSRAISMAKDVIYIHDWWLSPELYMRRPAAISQKWRLDRLLQRKAREGVKVFVIVYRNINSAIPIDSEYSKFSLLDLDDNIFVQRSPNQIRQGTFFWAHHEKLCVVDHIMAFIGGIDLCFGRWDTPAHNVADDKLTGFEQTDVPKDADHCQLWPGKDYSNPRVQDFYALDKPYEEMYDRSKVARMPWHDIGMQIVGQPARDLTRHFVQRWNYILRQRKPTRPTPFLLPPPDLSESDLEALGVKSTCEIQILRSCGMWSMGTPDHVEHSIMNAYVSMIEESERFVYIENQFFVTSTELEGTRIENHIGDALVERIIRAHKADQDWRAVVLIPLMPGFQNTVDSQDGTSIRLIMQCQFRSISSGPSSIFGRLRAEGIEPEDYIQFYSLRAWGQIGPGRALVSEQLYIHAKCMIVDDRVAIIGSANINERSMLGSRDSEAAAIIKDNELIWSTMGDAPYKVGKFAHTLRVRLMREHLGLDADDVPEEDEEPNEPAADLSEWAHSPSPSVRDIIAEPALVVPDDADVPETSKFRESVLARQEKYHSFNHDADRDQAENPHLQSGRKLTADPRVTDNEEHRRDVEGEGPDHMKASSSIERLTPVPPSLRQRTATVATSSPATTHSKSERSAAPSNERASTPLSPEPGLAPPRLERSTSHTLGVPPAHQLPSLPRTDDTDIGGPPHSVRWSPSPQPSHPLLQAPRPRLDRDCMRDPLSDRFYADVWHAVAEHNTALFRAVFRCQPDNEVQNWAQYREAERYQERFNRAQGATAINKGAKDMKGTSGPPGAGTGRGEAAKVLGAIQEAADVVEKKVEALGEKVADHVSPTRESGREKAPDPEKSRAEEPPAPPDDDDARQPRAPLSEKTPVADAKASATPRPSPPPPPASEAGSGSGSGVGGDASADSKAPRSTPSTVGTGSITKRANGRRRTASRASGLRPGDPIIGREEALELLGRLQGHLVIWPYNWLVEEEQGGGWLYGLDNLAPLEI